MARTAAVIYQFFLLVLAEGAASPLVECGLVRVTLLSKAGRHSDA